MSIRFKIDTGDGVEDVTSKDLLMQYAAFTGLRPLGVTQDGATALYNDNNGMLVRIPIHEMIHNSGMKIAEYRPEKAIPAKNMIKYRLALDSLSDPDAQEAYLKTVARKDFNIKDPQIMGQGDDRFLYDENTGEWVNLTNEQGLDASDIVSSAAGLAKGALSVGGGIVGGIGGAALGVPTGPGAVASAAFGAGIGAASGSALGDLGAAGIQAMWDPNFRESVGSLDAYRRSEGQNIGERALLSGAVGAVMPVAGRALRPLSTALRGAGGVATGTGQMLSAGARGLETDLGRMGMQLGLDPTGISGVGAVGGFARDIAAPLAQKTAQGLDFVRSGIHGAKGTIGPIKNIAGEAWSDTAKNIPNWGKFVSGVEKVGGGLENLGRLTENTMIGTTKGVGKALEYSGKGMSALGKAGQVLEPSGQQEVLKNAYGYLKNPAKGFGNIITNQGGSGPQNYVPVRPTPTPQTIQGFQIQQPTSQSLMDAIIARGGLPEW